MRAARVLAILACALGERRPSCLDNHPECGAWAARGECSVNPHYMEVSCAKACGTCGVRKDAFGHSVDLFGPEMNVEDRSTFANNLRINRDQPPTVPKFTETGHAVVPIPGDIFRKLVAARDAAVDGGNLRREGCTRGYLNNCGAHPTYTLPISASLKRATATATGEVLEKWIGDEWGGLVSTSVYGIRRYGNGSTLQAHVDVVATHAVSAILNVGQDVAAAWPLQIKDHAGRDHVVVMAPGEMVLYESASAIHGRVEPLNGTSYDNVFVHFRPARGWERFLHVPSGGVVSDHVEL
mmetsp:Transcript_3156/g.9612  ORF Transcript_3156/g.9612 Transcript_3156/m.9612 type:complete len:296 (+) Transcript_3156:27-914(+)